MIDIDWTVVSCISHLIMFCQDLSNVDVSTKLSAHKLLSERYQNMPNGYRPVRIDWKDLDRCNVCHMDEVRSQALTVLVFKSYAVSSKRWPIELFAVFFLSCTSKFCFVYSLFPISVARSSLFPLFISCTN